MTEVLQHYLLTCTFSWMGKLVDVDKGTVVSARLIQLKPEGRTSGRRQSRIAEAKSSDRILPNPC